MGFANCNTPLGTLHSNTLPRFPSYVGGPPRPAAPRACPSSTPTLGLNASPKASGLAGLF